MDKKIRNINRTMPMKTAEDLLALSHAYSLSKLSYINISQLEHLAHMMEHWPLLSELAQLTPNELD
ncbi:hypothetical protein TUM19329_30310 [Legionella antarctica]|uniref:Cellulose biosynthesis protein BcsR n=1 Tax=Legionella antarctica TaxID=2708020 RepID=A0A6F8T936_9GAMM|nr:cellulose biosynthesis protein BcsR [Legionella antarctica]BCA96670.1 hypothetical protein TUM19329_30310 [Legionella antarctica]